MIGLQKHQKRELKHNKVIQKELQELHKEVQYMNRKYQAQQHPDSDSDNDIIDRKAKKWWNRFDQRHFRTPPNRQYLRLRDITTSELIFQQSPPEPLPHLTYAQHNILNQYDLFNQPDLVHVLFKSKEPRFRCLASYLPSNQPSQPQQHPLQAQISTFKVTPSTSKEQELPKEQSQIKLYLAGFSQDEELCKSVHHYNRTLQKHSSKNQLEMQVYLWQKQLNNVNKQNQQSWQKLIKTIRKETPVQNHTQGQISTIRDYLMSMTILKYFEHGFGDKTTTLLQQLIDSQRQMKPAKSKDTNNKKFFQTDCKICFCSFNYDSNQVLYCDKCNTSFHLACYGLQELPKEQTYFCDYCRAIKKENAKKIVCQLCNKTKFPIKQIQGHFYHVTCLIMFNLVEIEDGSLVFRKGINHNKILQMVVDSELSQKQCQFCSHVAGGEVGIRMKCSFAGCSNSAHPICAYINGCKFWIRRDQERHKLDLSYHCNMHNASRDWIQQTYLRRYMCNFRKTSELKQSTFRELFQKQLQKMYSSLYARQEGQSQVHTWNSSKIINKTRYLKRRFNQQEQKTSTSSEVQTETMKMLEKFKKKK